MIDRPIQVITSDYGRRFIQGVPGDFHSGVDLRSFDDTFTHKLDVVLPEDAIFLRAVYEEKWGWTVVFEGIKSGMEEIRFTHLSVYEKNFTPGRIYFQGAKVGLTGVTKFMMEMRPKPLGEHLHLSVWEKNEKNQLVHTDPKPYLTSLGHLYKYKSL